MIKTLLDQSCDDPLMLSSPRLPLVLADWLEEQGDPIAGLIRLQYEWATVRATGRWNGEAVDHLIYLERIPEYRRVNEGMFGLLNQDGYRPTFHFGVLHLDLTPKDFLAVNSVVSEDLWQWVGSLRVRLPSHGTEKMLSHPRFQDVRRLDIEDESQNVRPTDPGVARSRIARQVLCEQPLPKLRALDLSYLHPHTVADFSMAPWWKQINFLEIALEDQPVQLFEAIGRCPLQAVSLKRMNGMWPVDEGAQVGDELSLANVVNALPTTVRRIYIANDYTGDLEADWGRLPNLEGVHYYPRRREVGDRFIARPYPTIWNQVIMWGV